MSTRLRICFKASNKRKSSQIHRSQCSLEPSSLLIVASSISFFLLLLIFFFPGYHLLSTHREYRVLPAFSLISLVILAIFVSVGHPAITHHKTAAVWLQRSCFCPQGPLMLELWPQGSSLQDALPRRPCPWCCSASSRTCDPLHPAASWGNVRGGWPAPYEVLARRGMCLFCSHSFVQYLEDSATRGAGMCSCLAGWFPPSSDSVQVLESFCWTAAIASILCISLFGKIIYRLTNQDLHISNNVTWLSKWHNHGSCTGLSEFSLTANQRNWSL